jgi:hypothetical protein
VDDDWLRGNPQRIPPLLDRARLQAIRYAAANDALARSVQLQAPVVNDPTGDVLFGAREIAVGSPFIVADVTNPAQLDLDHIHSVLVRDWRTRARGQPVSVLLGGLVAQPYADVGGVAQATLDRDVIGFRPRYGQPIPLAPVGLFSDPSGADTRSWENQIIQRHGSDQYRFVSVASGFVADPHGDGLPEITLQLQLAPTGVASLSTAYLLTVGGAGPESQVATGVGPADLVGLGGQLVLDATNRLVLPARALAPPNGSPSYAQLLQGLQLLTARPEPRIWPLVSSYADGTHQATVTGFVAARVVKVDAPPGGPLSFTLQPAMLAAASALTDLTRRGAPGLLLPNPYIAKVRRVE